MLAAFAEVWTRSGSSVDSRAIRSLPRSMRRIKVEIDLSQYLRLGMSFDVCRELHLWPPLVTLNRFLECGVDDVTGATTMTWEPLELSSEENQEAVRVVDPSGSFESFATDDGDWQRWFEMAVARALRLRDE